MTKYVLTGLFLTILLSGYSQVKVSNDTLHWNENRPLIWSDFKGSPTEGQVLHGQVLCINLAGFQRPSAHHETQFHIVSVFDRMNSWMPENERTDLGLSYFQVMFNIYELHARKMRKEYKESRSAKDPDAAFQEKYSQSGNERSTDLNKFKMQTKSGLDSVAVGNWRLNLETELKALEVYRK